MHWLHADHSFHVLKSSGRNDGQVLAEIGDATDLGEPVGHESKSEYACFGCSTCSGYIALRMLRFATV